MAHLWVRSKDDEWRELPLEATALDMTQYPPAPLRSPSAASNVALFPRQAETAGWVLLWRHGHDVYINGIPLDTGIRLLQNRDEVRIDGRDPLFFSTEVLPFVESFTAADRDVYCPRDKSKVEPGTPSVRCPQCGVVYHQSEDRPCYTYSPHCATCPRSTDLEAGYEWVPSDI